MLSTLVPAPAAGVVDEAATGTRLAALVDRVRMRGGAGRRLPRRLAALPGGARAQPGPGVAAPFGRRGRRGGGGAADERCGVIETARVVVYLAAESAGHAGPA